MARLSFINGGWYRLPKAEQARLAATHRLTRRQGWRGLLDRLRGDHDRLW